MKKALICLLLGVLLGVGINSGYKYCNKNVDSVHTINIDDEISKLEQLIEEEKYDETFSSIKETLEIIEKYDRSKLSQYSGEISDIFKNILYVPGSREEIINIFEIILKNENDMDPYILLTLKSNLAALYQFNVNYAKSIEECLDIIKIVENSGNKELYYFSAIAKADIGTIFQMLKYEEEGIKWLYDAWNTEIEDELDNAYLRIYVLCNLYESITETEDPIEINNTNEYIENLIENSPDVLADEIRGLNLLLKANNNLTLNNIEKAKTLLNEYEENFAFNEGKIFMDVDLYFYTIKGDIALLENNYDEACKNFNIVLESSMENLNYINAKPVLYRLIDIYKTLNNPDKVLFYTKELENIYEKECLFINEDYSEYALYKYEVINNIIATQKNKIFLIIIVIFLTVLLLILIICSYIKFKTLNKINKQDTLTTAYNRSYFDKNYRNFIKKGCNFAIIIIDIDNFKKINDTYGHAFGDTVLKRIVFTIQSDNKLKDKFYRYGGEEFALILDENYIKSLYDICETIRKNIENIKWDNNIKVTVSIGASYGKAGEKEVFHEADNNLYISKNTGKNKITITKGYC